MRRGWIVGLTLAVLMAGAALPGEGQGPVLVRDIATGPVYSPGSNPGPPVRFRGRDYFGAEDGFFGYELWTTDGTLGGTRLAADLCPGRCWGRPWLLTPSGGLLFFIAGNTTGGSDSYWIWRSDGTSGGTFPLADLKIPGSGFFGPASFFAPFRSGVVFLVRDRARRGWSLWGSDGTHAGTGPIAPLPVLPANADAPSNADWVGAFDDARHHHFSWRGRLWVTDGTAAGTGPVPMRVQLCSGAARIGDLVVHGGEQATWDCEPWVSDGTARGSRMLRDIGPGEATAYPGGFVAAGDLVYFTAFNDRGSRLLWKTDGTPQGTRIVRGPGSHWLGKVEILGVVGARLYFAANDGEHGVELWRTDGSQDSTALVADLSPGAAGTYFVGGAQSLGSGLIFTAWPSGEKDTVLFRTRGTADSTVRLASTGFRGQILSAAGDRVYFVGFVPGEEEQAELGVTDGTVAGTRVLDLAHPIASSDPHQLIAGSRGLVFLAADSEQGVDLWRSGGHSGDTEPLGDIVPGYNYSEGMRLAPGSGGAFYFTYEEQRIGWTDGQTVRDLLPPHTLAFPNGFVDLDDRTVFLAPRPISETEWQPWVWSSDGTPEGTTPVSVADHVTSSFYTDFRLHAARAPLSGDMRYLVQKVPSFPEHLSNLSEADGTAAGTHALARIPARRYEYIFEMTAAGPSTFVSFWSNSSVSLWASDGTAEGTRKVYAAAGPFTLSFIEELTAAGQQAFFLGDDFEYGRELWASDGTLEGTRRVVDLAPGAASSSPSDVAAFGDRVLFSADDGEHGRELWVSDGTAEGTHLLEIQPGPRGSYPQAFRVIGDQVVFAADDGVHGLEPWVTDGTPEGTRLAADVMAGPRSSGPRNFEAFGGELFFNAGRLQEGYELWKLPLEAVEP